MEIWGRGTEVPTVILLTRQSVKNSLNLKNKFRCHIMHLDDYSLRQVGEPLVINASGKKFDQVLGVRVGVSQCMNSDQIFFNSTIELEKKKRGI